MFQATTIDGVPMMVRVSFGQWVKAGIAFTFGAALASVVIGLVSMLVWLSFISAVARALLKH